MASPSSAYEFKPKPQLTISFQSHVNLETESVGVQIPLLGVNIETIDPESSTSMKVTAPEGLVDLTFDVNFRSLNDRISVSATVWARRIRSIRIVQKRVDDVTIDVEHHNDGYGQIIENCKLRCSQGRPLSAPGHCIDCAGPLGRVRLCC